MISLEKSRRSWKDAGTKRTIQIVKCTLPESHAISRILYFHFVSVHSYKMRMKKMMGDDDEIDLDGSAYQILDSSVADVSMLSTS